MRLSGNGFYYKGFAAQSGFESWTGSKKAVVIPAAAAEPKKRLVEAQPRNEHKVAHFRCDERSFRRWLRDAVYAGGELCERAGKEGKIHMSLAQICGRGNGFSKCRAFFDKRSCVWLAAKAEVEKDARRGLKLRQSQNILQNAPIAVRKIDEGQICGPRFDFRAESVFFGHTR